MSATIELVGNERDAGVVEEICGYVTSQPAKSFFLFAGAGSGKTRTLVEVLRRLTGAEDHEAGQAFGRRLRARGQSIRVITYTKNAVAVVNGRLGNNDLTSVSTIHSFCWDLIQGFDDDIRDGLLAMNTGEQEKAKAMAASRKKGPTDKDKETIVKLDATAAALMSVGTFVYNPDRNTYGAGALQHDQVLSVCAWLLNERSTLRRILTDRHPVILIDESQDTMKGVLDALLRVAAEAPTRLTIGLLGDHRQRVYAHGYSDLSKHVPPAWAKPKLQMNHRSQKRIVDLINCIWEADLEGRTQAKTGVRQHPREEKGGGIVRIFIGDASLDSDEKVRREALCAKEMARATACNAWRDDVKRYHVLALEHKLAARRGRFLDVFEAMLLLDPEAAAPQGNGENTGPSVVRDLLGPISQLAGCVNADGTVDEFAATELLNRQGRLANLSPDVAVRRKRLAELDNGVAKFALACSQPGALVKEVLAPAVEFGLFDLDGRLVDACNDTTAPPPAPAVKADEPKEDRKRRGWYALLNARWDELARYRAYLAGKAELATHQVVKGSEFEHVMVVMDDADAGGSLYSYDKVFGAAQLSKTDQENVRENKETAVDRTLRPLYVTCSRARESLALVLWAKDPQAALAHMRKASWFSEAEVAAVPQA